MTHETVTMLSTAEHAITAVARRDTANLAALTLLIEGLRPLLGALATEQGIRTGEDDGDDRTAPGMELTSYARKVSGGNIRAELDGYVLGLTPEGELVGGEAGGRWDDREGYTWHATLAPVTVKEAASRVWADDVATHVERILRDRAECANARSARLIALADGLRAALAPGLWDGHAKEEI